MPKRPQVRAAILDILKKRQGPVRASEILGLVQSRFPVANKTTIYRGLEILSKEGLVNTVIFGDRNRRYEISALPHHHHLVCTSCNKIEEIFLGNELNSVEKELVKQRKFAKIEHALEFFGTCQKCNKQSNQS